MFLQGINTALITPFDGNRIDDEALRALVRAQIGAGVHGLIACGTTAETPALSEGEFDDVVKLVVEEVGGRVPVIAGTGTNNVDETLDRTHRARRFGADAALVVTPYYNKPQQEGMFQHFARVAAEGGLPVVLYNVPGRTGVNLLPETVIRLSHVPNVVAVKEASGSVGQARDIIAGVKPDFAVISGDDGLFLPTLAVGGRGVISVASNVAPGSLVALWNAWQAGRVAEAAAIDRTLAPLYWALFVEPSPVPVKAAAQLLGICTDAVRLPLVSASPKTREAVRDALVAAGFAVG